MMIVYIFICFVRGRIFGDLAISKAPSLSSNALHIIIGSFVLKENSASFNSSRKFIIGITYLNAVDSEVYSVSVELNATSVCNREAQAIGKFAYLIT